MITFEAALEAVSQLPIEQQEVLIDILKKRNIEVRRNQILEECRGEHPTFVELPSSPSSFSQEGRRGAGLKSLSRPGRGI